MLERHKRILLKQNPLWRDEKLDTFEFKRDLYHTLKEHLQYPQIIAVIGLRRVGKTVLLKQIISYLYEDTDAHNLCYISFDDRDFQSYETAEELINYFLQPSDEGHIRYLFLDEIQKVPDWPDLLKTVYDTEKNLKIVVSGSSSLEMKDYRETLAGRLISLKLPIFTFKEYVRYFGLESKVDKDRLTEEYDKKFLLKKELYEDLFKEYLLKGAFPELLDIDDEEFIKRYIRESVIEKVIVDISKAFSSKREDIVLELLRIFSKNTANLFHKNSLSNTLDISRDTTARYIDLLEKGFLIKVIYNHTKSVVKQARTSKKAHIAHSSIPIALLDFPPDILEIDGTDRGHLVESVIANSFEDVAFWRGPRKQEVDIIIDKRPPLAIEVKYREHINVSNLKGLLKFMDEYDLEKGIVVTKDELKNEEINGKTIDYIPAWLFLLIEW